MPHPEQILSSDLIVGSWFSRYHVDIVDCVMLEYFANSYSDHFRSKRSWVILSRIFIILITPYLVLFYEYYNTTKTNGQLAFPYLFNVITLNAYF